MPIQIRVFGPISAANASGEPIWFRTRKTASLFGHLAASLGKQIARETLTAIFWAEAEESFARNSLSVSLASLRKQLEPEPTLAGKVLVADNHTVGLSSEHVWSDVDEFHRCLKK